MHHRYPNSSKTPNCNAKWYISFTYSAFHKTFDKRFLKMIWNSRSLLQTWQFHYVVFDQIVNFDTKLWISRQICWEIAKFIGSEVPVIWCSQFGNIGTNEFKQSEKKKSTTQGLFYDVYFWNVKYLRGMDGLHITDGWRD